MKSLPKKPPACISKNKDASEEYVRILPFLEEMGSNIPDFSVVVCHCQNFADYWEAKRNVFENGSVTTTPKGFIQTSPWVSIARDAQEKMIRTYKELLITPGCRKRLSINTADDEESDGFFEGNTP